MRGASDAGLTAKPRTTSAKLAHAKFAMFQFFRRSDMKTKSGRAKDKRKHATRKASSPQPRKCGCGCGATVERRFKPGHDARVKPGSKWREQHPELFKQ